MLQGSQVLVKVQLQLRRRLRRQQRTVQLLLRLANKLRVLKVPTYSSIICLRNSVTRTWRKPSSPLAPYCPPKCLLINRPTSPSALVRILLKHVQYHLHKHITIGDRGWLDHGTMVRYSSPGPNWWGPWDKATQSKSFGHTACSLTLSPGPHPIGNRWSQVTPG
jgi:hypothetical protein